MISPQELPPDIGFKLWLGIEKIMMIAGGALYSTLALGKYIVESRGGVYHNIFPRSWKTDRPNYFRMAKGKGRYELLPEELLPDDFRTKEHEEKEAKQLEQLVINRLIDHGDLKESRVWYATKRQSLEFAQMTLEDLKNPDSNASREIRLLEDILTNSDFQSLVQGRCLDILDIGCGNGEKAKRIVNHCGQVNYVPVDVSPYMIAIATGNICNEFGLNARQFTVPGLLSRLTATGVSSLLVRQSIYQKRRDLKKQRKRLTRLLGDNKLKKYLSKINNDQTITDSLKVLEGLAGKVKQTEDSLRSLSSELKTCDKRRLLEIYYNIIGDNFSIQKQLMTAFEDTVKFSLVFYPVRFLECAIFWPGPTIDYIVGKLTNFRLSEDHGIFSPYFFDGVHYGQDDSRIAMRGGQINSSSRIYAFRQSLRSLFWPKKEKVRQQLEILIKNFNTLIDLQPRTNLDPDEKLNIPSDLVLKDFSQENMLESILDVTLRYRLYNNQRLYLFLGQTLGNFSAVERRELVDKFYQTMSEGDMMLVGVELRPQEESHGFEDHVRLMERNYSRGSDFLNPILNAAGIQPSDVEYQAVYNRVTNQMEMGYRVVADQVVVTNSKKSKIFKKGEIIPVASSHKFAVNEVRSLFEHSGFTVVGHKMYTPLRSDLEGSVKESHQEYEVLLVRK